MKMSIFPNFVMLAGIPVIATSAQHSTLAESRPISYNIEEQVLDSAINQWAKQTGYQVLLPLESTPNNRIASSVKGAYTPESALKVLLASTNLSYQFVNPHTVAIRATDKTPEGHDSASGRLDQVVVTAQKRVENLQDVPVPVTAISAQTLLESNELRLQDYYTKVPGLNLTPGPGGFPSVSIRGLTSGAFTNPMVGVAVDDVLFTSATLNGGGYVPPDLDPNDLARVEVLRGPQGTLYGASSMGGLIKYMTIAPSPDHFSGRAQAGLASVKGGNELGYGARAAVNLPLSDVFAIRASGFSRLDPGYIDQIAAFDSGRQDRDVNEGRATGGRLAALWQPRDTFSLMLSAMLQDKKVHGSDYANLGPDFKDLQQLGLRGSGDHNNKTQFFSATARATFRGAELTSISAYGVNKLFQIDDYTLVPFLSGLSRAFFNVPGFVSTPTRRASRYTQEFRLSTPLSDHLDLLAGVFYTHEKARLAQSGIAVDPVTLQTAGSIFNAIEPSSTFSEYAAFANLTVNVTDRFDIQFGGRASENRQAFSTIGEGIYYELFYGASPYAPPKVHSKESPFTYLVTPRFKFSPNLMAYVRMASGYRPGGPNINGDIVGHPTYESDATRNYEIGVKGDVSDGAVSFDASLYRVDWRDMQLSVFAPSIGGVFLDNASKAQGKGVELSVEARPMHGLTVSGWIAYSDAQLVEDFPTAVGTQRRGDALPFSSPWSGSVSLDQQFPLTASFRGTFGASVSYVGERASSIGSPGLQSFPSYVQADVRAAAKHGPWTANVFVTNIADRRGLLAGNPTTATRVTYIQPRTVGASISRDF